MPEWSDQEFLRTVFDETRVVRTPLRGIISGYHVLPYVLVGPPEYERTSKTVEVRGRIRVSPRLVLGGDAPTYGEMFGERELMDTRIVARVFSFRYAPRVSLESEDLAIRRHEADPGTQLERVLEDLPRPLYPRDPGPGISRLVSIRVRSSGSTGLTRCAANPASRPRARSSGSLYPVNAIMTGDAGSAFIRRATS